MGNVNEKKLKVGVIGVGRGMSLAEYCEIAGNVELVAVCDRRVEETEHFVKWAEELGRLHGKKEPKLARYTDYDEFLRHDMDAVVLANYATEHATFAVKALRAGKHVISEVLPCETLKEAVELIETVEETGLKYCYSENYCYMAAPYEMRRLYKEGKLGELEYAEGEYIHNCETIWPSVTYGNPTHWRNNTHAFFYCTHSIGPIVHATGLRPVKVAGFEMPHDATCRRLGRHCGIAAMEVLTMENGAVVRSTHGDLKRSSIWYSIQGSKGAAESKRGEEGSGGTGHIYTCLYPEDNSYLTPERASYAPTFPDNGSGHGGSDFRCMDNAARCIMGDPDADAIDVYEAMDMFLPGIFAHFSSVCGGRELDIPDLRLKSERDKYRNDTRCVNPAKAGDMLLPTMPGGTPEVPDEVYKRIRDIYEKEYAESEAARLKAEREYEEEKARKAAEGETEK